MNKENFIDSKIKELSDGTYICLDFDSVHIQTSTNRDKVLKSLSPKTKREVSSFHAQG